MLARVGKELGGNEVMLGGDAAMGCVEVLHGGGVDGGDQICDGVWKGGLNACRQMVRDGTAGANEFVVVLSFLRWTGEMLREEMGMGAWEGVAVDGDWIMEEVREGRTDCLWDEIRARL